MSVLHLWSQYQPKDADETRRNTVAAASWSTQPWKACPVNAESLPRLFKDSNGISLPFIGDLLDMASKDAPHDAIIVLTNADTVVATDATLRIVSALQHRDVCYAFRRDFYHRMTTPPADKDFHKGADYPGSDLHACRVRWWRTYRAMWPPMVLGREAWDLCFRVLMEATCMAKPLSLPNLIAHERHPNGWENPSIRYSIPGQIHNRNLAGPFLARYNVQWK